MRHDNNCSVAAVLLPHSGQYNDEAYISNQKFLYRLCACHTPNKKILRLSVIMIENEKKIKEKELEYR